VPAWWQNKWVIGGAAAGLGLFLARKVFGSPKIGAVIRAPGLEDYYITEDDLLWLGRSIQCESGSEEAAHAWVLIQRFCALRQQSPATWGNKSFGYLIQAFSSPVNYRWLPGGSLYEANPDHRAASEPAQALRRRCMALEPEAFRPAVKSVLNAVRASSLHNPVPGYTNFNASDGEPCPSGAVNVGGNCFIASPPVEGPVELV